MANPEWGTKRICQSCSAKFYDLNRDPIVCPKCQTEFDPEAFLKTRRTRPSSIVEKDTDTAPGVAADNESEDLEATESEETEAGEEEEEDEDLIEDASELGEDEDDLAEVIENVDEEEER